MSTSITRRIPFSAYEFEALESWLCHMAKEGFSLQSTFMVWAFFEKGTPLSGKYRVLPKGLRSMSDEEKEIYAASGWNYVCSVLNCYIFYADEPDAPELFTDSNSFLSYWKRRYIGRFVLEVLLALFMFSTFFQAVSGVSDAFPGPVTLCCELGALFLFFLLLLAVFLLYMLGFYLTYLLLLFRRLKRQKTILHNVPFEKAARRNRLETGCALFLAVGLIAGIIVSHNFPYTSVSMDETLAFSGSHPVMLSEIDPKSWEPVEKCLKANNWQEDMDHSADAWSNLLFSSIVNVVTDSGTTLFRSNYYEARHEKIAAQFFREQSRSIPGLHTLSEASAMGLDCALYEKDEDGYAHLYLKKGKKVEMVTYLGKEHLPDHFPAIAQDL